MRIGEAMGMMDLRSIIEGLLAKGYEGGYWDYKSDYPNTVEEKLHDIICMANNLENRDAYLIYGANDDGSICGIEKTQKVRYTSADIIKFLRTKPFASGYIPQVEVYTLKMEGHELDVLVIVRGMHTPYYLQEEFGKTNKIIDRVRPGAIYTRTANMNTPRDKTASIEHTEYLWRKHFGYDLQPTKRFELLLEDYKGWSEANWNVSRQQYHKDYPEYRIIVGNSDDGYDHISYFYDDERMLYAELKLDYLSTTLYETEIWYMDLGRCIIPKPEWNYMIGQKIIYYYFIKNTMNGKLLGLITNGRYVCSNRSGQEMPIMIFENEDERRKFEEYLLEMDVLITAEIKKNIQTNAIMKHIIGKEERKGKAEIGVEDIAFAFAVYRRWRKEISINY